MTIALTIADGSVRTLDWTQVGLEARSFELDFISVPSTPANLRAMSKLSIPHACCEGCVLVAGEHARHYAELFQVEIQSLMPDGHVLIGDIPGRQLLANLFEQVLPAARVDGDYCCRTRIERREGVSISKAQQQADRLIDQIVRLRGYRLIEIPASQAVLLSEMVTSQFTGIAVQWQDRTAHLYAARQGTTLLSESLDLSEVSVETLNHCLRTETFPSVESLRRAIGELIQAASTAVSSIPSTAVMGLSLRLVVAGALLEHDVVRDMVRAVAESTRWQYPLEAIFTVSDPFAAARGCLIHTELERRLAVQQEQAA